MGLTDKLPHAHHSTDDNEEPPPLNPLAPRAKINPSNDSIASGTRPACFTPLQLGGIHSPSSISIADSDRSHDTVFSGQDIIRDLKAEILANWLHTKQEERVWTFGASGEGVFMKRAKGSYACAPQGVQNDGTGLYQAVVELNVRVRERIIVHCYRLCLTRTSAP